jgi:hypothetical protein
MVNASVSFGVSAYASFVNYHLSVAIDEKEYFKTTSAEEVAWLLNKYAEKIVISEYGYGYVADVPENAALALRYLAYIKKAPSKEELDDIVATGTTRLHKFARELGLNVEGRTMADLLNGDIETQRFILTLKDFPTLSLMLKGEMLEVKFKADSVDISFLRRMLHDETCEGEVEMLGGISLLREKAQDKYMHLLTTGHLTMDGLAEGLCRSAVSSKDKCVWGRVAEWLKTNGYGEKSSEIIVKKTLCN